MSWCPHITVAAIIEKDDRFLLVKELIDGNTVFNQPAGHLEAGESLTDAITRETLEETAWDIEPDGVVGIYRMHLDKKDITYVRICFTGKLLMHHPERTLDSEIIETTWMTREEMEKHRHNMRSPLVIQCIDDYLSGQRLPISTIKDVGNV